MTTWLERKWDLFSDRVLEAVTEEVETEPEYLDNDIGPLLYAINPVRVA